MDRSPPGPPSPRIFPRSYGDAYVHVPQAFPGGGGGVGRECSCISFAIPSPSSSLPIPSGASALEGCICTPVGPGEVVWEQDGCSVRLWVAPPPLVLATSRRRDGGRVRGRTNADLEGTKMEHERTCGGSERKEGRGGGIEGGGVDDEVVHVDEERKT